jgi:hypothetical protein
MNTGSLCRGFGHDIVVALIRENDGFCYSRAASRQNSKENKTPFNVPSLNFLIIYVYPLDKKTVPSIGFHIIVMEIPIAVMSPLGARAIFDNKVLPVAVVPDNQHIVQKSVRHGISAGVQLYIDNSRRVLGKF